MCGYIRVSVCAVQSWIDWVCYKAAVAVSVLLYRTRRERAGSIGERKRSKCNAVLFVVR